MCFYRSRFHRVIQALCIMAGVWQGSTSLAANSRFIAFDSDATTEISTNTVYTHLMDMGTAGGDYVNPVVNGVTFTSVSGDSGTLLGTDGNTYGWRGFPTSSHPGWDSPWISTPAGNNIRKVLTDMNYGLASGTFYLSGLTPGQKYEVRFYNRTWSAGNRYQTFTFQPGSSAQEIVTFNEDDWKGEKILAYSYVADENGELVIGVQAEDSNATYHFYGLSNQKIVSSFFSSGTTVTNDNGHYSVGATLGGYNAGAEVSLVWGLSAGSFTFTNTTTTVTAGQPIYLEATNIIANTSYFYKMFVNEGGQIVDVAANVSDSFFTGDRDVWVTQSGTMNEAGPTSATLTFHRTGNTDEALTVDYKIGGTAVIGLDYLTNGVNGDIVIPAGETTADLVLTPIRNFAVEQSPSISVVLQTGPYAIVEPSSQQLSIVKYPTTYVESTYTNNGVSMVYRVYTPNSYQAEGEKLPVVVYLHSAAERGNVWNAVFANNGWTNNWINNLITETQVGTHQAVLVIPQSGYAKVWNSMNNGDRWGIGNYTNAEQGEISPQLQLAKEILDHVVGTYNVDADRLYLTGASMGGYGAWDMLDRFPSTFAAVMPLSGGGNTDAAKTEAFASTPVWAYHGAQDSLITPANTTELIKIMRGRGGKTVYSRPASQGHGGFDTFYLNGYYTEKSPSTTGGTGKTVYDWLFEQRLSEHALTPLGVSPIILDMQIGGWVNNVSGTTADGSNDVYYAQIYPVPGSVSNIPAINGVSSGISVTYVSGTYSANQRLLSPAEYSQFGVTRNLSAAITSRFPQSVYMYAVSGKVSDPLTYRLSGLNPNYRYTFEFFGGFENWGAGSYTTTFTVTGANTKSGTLLVATNYENLLTLPRIVPASDGTIIMTFVGGTDDTGVMNCLRIVPLKPTSTVMVLR